MNDTAISTGRLEIGAAIRAAIKESYRDGDCWVYATLFPDGEIRSGSEKGPHYPRDEFRPELRPVPVTFFSRYSRYEDHYSRWADGLDGLDESGIDSYLDDALDCLDIEAEIDDAVSAVEAAGYSVRD